MLLIKAENYFLIFYVLEVDLRLSTIKSRVVATTSLSTEVHAWNRANLQGYFEAYLRVPIEELRRRDPKGIYRRFDAGEIKNVAGLDLHIDEPEAPDWIGEFLPGRTVDELANELLTAFLNETN